jgi:Kef-type K+ transport system membrane component KefB
VRHDVSDGHILTTDAPIAPILARLAVMSEETIASLAFILACAVAAPLIADLVKPWLVVPTVVLEIALGIVIGPNLLHLAREDAFITGLSQVGLCMLMLLAGYEINFARISGRPLTLASAGWLMSLVIAFAVTAALMLLGHHPTGVREFALGLAFATTAIGTLLPILKDAGDTQTRFGTFILAAGAIGEFGPIVGVSLLLASDNPIHTMVLLGLFVIVAAIAISLAMQPRRGRVLRLMGETLTTSAQLAVRVAIVISILLIWLAEALDLDVLLGAFTAGVVLRLFLSSLPGEHREVVESKLEAVAFGFVVPVFFVTSGMALEVDSLINDAAMLLLIPVFFATFLVVRGLPALTLYTRDLRTNDRRALALYCATGLPMVVVISTLAVGERLIEPPVAAALVAAAMLTVLVLPLLAARLRGSPSPELVDGLA